MKSTSPCHDCNAAAKCENSGCRKWELWFTGYWRALRRKYLGVRVPVNKEEKR